MLGVCDLRVELKAVHGGSILGSCDGSPRAVLSACNSRESFREGSHLVTVAHPNNVVLVVNAIEEISLLGSVLALLGHNSLAVLALGRCLDLAAVVVHELLHSVADAQERDLLSLNPLPESLCDVGGSLVVHGRGASGKHNSDDIGALEHFNIDEAGVQLAENVLLADTAGNEVAELAAEVKNSNLLAVAGELASESTSLLNGLAHAGALLLEGGTGLVCVHLA
mmetsp:Transcript_2260/g.5217  ORF Transcript_2260/g.5217 Transcript_2260/m.5217 type:complete len:224 (+) Transcript_2260:1435-2106(+)